MNAKESTMNRSNHPAYKKIAATLEARLAKEQALSDFAFKLRSIHEAGLRDHLAARGKPQVKAP